MTTGNIPLLVKTLFCQEKSKTYSCLPMPPIRPSLRRTKLEFKKQSCVFWVLFMYKVERKKLEIPEMSGSALTGVVQNPLGPLKVKIEVVRKVGFLVLKRSVFEPRSQRSNKKRNHNSSDREIVQKPPKFVPLGNISHFMHFLEDFLVQ